MLDSSRLHKYQLDCIDKVFSNKEYALFLDMGLGKTATTLHAIAKLIDSLDVSKVLVVAPLYVCNSTWMDEYRKWTGTNHLWVNLCTGSVKNRVEKLNSNANLYIINIDKVAWLNEAMTCGEVTTKFDMLVIDELSKFRNPKKSKENKNTGERSKTRFGHMIDIRNNIDRVLGLTGTPTPNGMLNLWSQMYLIDRGVSLFSRLSTYQRAYFHREQGGMFSKYVINGNYATSEILRRISQKVTALKAEQANIKIENIYDVIGISFDKLTAKRYKDYENRCLVELSELGSELTPTSGGALVTKLLQFTGGAVYRKQIDTNAPKQYDIISHDKLNTMCSYIDSLPDGENILVSYAFKHEEERIYKTLTKKFPEKRIVCFSGRNKEIDDWNEGDINILIAHPASIGHGINLQNGGRILIWYSLTYNLELYEQMNARLIRQGQKEQVFIKHLIANNTIDEEVFNVINSKGENQKAIMQKLIQDKLDNLYKNGY